jgi:hypothetical protein
MLGEHAHSAGLGVQRGALATAPGCLNCCSPSPPRLPSGVCRCMPSWGTATSGVAAAA